MKTRNDLRARIKDVIRPNGIGAITADAHQELLLELVDILGAEIDEVEAVTDVVSDGNYPAMTVGYSDNLVGRGESTPEIFSFRASGGRSINDGTARIKTLRGNAVVWNNIAQTLTQGNKAFPKGAQIVKGHKYVIVANDLNGYGVFIFTRKNSTSQQIAGALGDEKGVKFFTSEYDAVSTGEDNEDNSIWWYIEGSYAQANLYDLTKMFGQGNEPTTADAFNAMLPLNVDLTAYNEGEVIPFNATAIKAIGDNAWDEEWESGNFDNGQPIYDASRIRSKNYIRIIGGKQYASTKRVYFVYYDKEKNYISSDYDMLTTAPQNAYYMKFSAGSSGEPITTYKDDITISLYHSGYKEGQYYPYTYNIRNIDTRILELFPNGMHKWDRAYNKNGRGYVVKGTGKVDMGSLMWQLNADGRFETSFSSVRPSVSVTEVGGILCRKYAAVSALDTYNGINGISIDNVSKIWIRDSAYTDAASFKAAMQGVMLYYELAEPQVYEFSEPFNLDYEVADFGTEEVIASKPSAPISADIIYQFNAVDSIRDLLTRVASLEARL